MNVSHKTQGKYYYIEALVCNTSKNLPKTHTKTNYMYT